MEVVDVVATRAIRSACADGGAILESLREERRCVAAVLRGLDASRWKKPSTNLERGRKEQALVESSTNACGTYSTFVSNILDNYLLTFFRCLRGREGRQSARGVVMVMDERQPRRHR